MRCIFILKSCSIRRSQKQRLLYGRQMVSVSEASLAVPVENVLSHPSREPVDGIDEDVTEHCSQF